MPVRLVVTGRAAAASATSTVPSLRVKRLIARSSGAGAASAVAAVAEEAAGALAAACGAEAGDAASGALAGALADALVPPATGTRVAAAAPGCAAKVRCTL